ncbi:protein SCO1 homolog, mitochondrial [Aplysia californica]|uniref:Protein SCO1 homolog, mitochondrial n=1 Tax=Aplysia californica TaxID=6500 RepID=A0ABM0K3A2_APLCA|nr:protein SCO1 homolog, mitochondrial [Aplysia californica]
MITFVYNSAMRLCSQCFRLFAQETSCSVCQSVRTGSRLVYSWPLVRSMGTLQTPLTSAVGRHVGRHSNSYLRQGQVLGISGHFPVAGPSLFSQVQTFSTSGPQQPPKKKSKENTGKSPISWKNLLIVAGIGGVFLIGMNYVKKEKELERQIAKNRKMGKAKLGGDWELTDHHGNRRSSVDFRGQWILIYFGFTNCPDICPEEIEKIVAVLEKCDADSDMPKIQPIVITVDPERDTAEALKEYLSEFSPRLLGFTGTIEDINAATRAYRVYFSAGPKDEDNDYIVDHSIISYLVNPKGEFVDYFGQNKTAPEMFNSMKLHIYTYNRNERHK